MQKFIYFLENKYFVIQETEISSLIGSVQWILSKWVTNDHRSDFL